MPYAVRQSPRIRIFIRYIKGNREGIIILRQISIPALAPLRAFLEVMTINTVKIKTVKKTAAVFILFIISPIKYIPIIIIISLFWVISLKEFKFISHKKKDKIKVFDNTDGLSDLEKSYGVRTEIFLNKSATVEGCLGVLDYKNEYIKIRVKKGYMIFTGKALEISLYEENIIKIRGIISNVEYCL